MRRKDFFLKDFSLQILTYVFDQLYFTQSLTSFSSTNHILHLCAWLLILFYLTQIDLLINPPANLDVFGDFNVHHKDWLTYSGRTDRPGELCYNLSISNDLTQMVNFHTWIPDCDSHSPALLDFFLSDAGICSTIASPPLGNSDHVFVSFLLTFH